MKLLVLFLTFLKVGAFTFGGGYAMLPLIQAEVENHGWLESSDIVNFIAVSESTPGPFAINISTYVGMKVGGFFGALCATLGVVLPSFIIILIVARFFAKFNETKGVKGVMSGLKPAVIGLIGSAALSIFITVFFPSGLTLGIFKSPSFYISLGIFAVSCAAVFKKIHPIIVICFAAAAGIAFGYIFNIPV